MNEALDIRPPGPWGRLLADHVVLGEAFETFLDELGRGDGALPFLPQAAMELLELVNTPDVPFETMASKAGADPSVSSRIMAVASSPMYAGRAPAGLKEALARLGLEGVRYVAWDLAFQARMLRRGPLLDVVNKTVRHARTMSAIARILAPSLSTDPSSAGLAGMMHALGALVIADVASAKGGKRPLPTHLAILAMRVLHPWVSARTASRMRIPREICHALDGHHRPKGDLARLVLFADLAAPDEPGQRALELEHALAAARLDLPVRDVRKLLAPLHLSIDAVKETDDERRAREYAAALGGTGF